jgi:fatty acid-binding protein DegV
MAAMVHKMELYADGGREYSDQCYISHSACLDDAKAVAAMIEDRFPHLRGHIELHNVGAIIGSHTGPGTVCLFFWGKPRAE